MKLDYGNEEGYVDFVKNLNAKDVVALISHTDLDGLAAAHVTNKILNAKIVKLLGYGDLNDDLVKKLKEKGVNKIVFTDLFIKQEDLVEKLEEFADVMILDHHLSSKDLNSERTTFLKCESGYCAGYLCYDLARKIDSKIEKLDWLVACSCISDYCYKKPEDWIRKVMEKYGDKFEEDGSYVRKSGKFWDIQWKLSLALIYFKDDLNRVLDNLGEEFGEIGDLGKHADEVQNEIDRILSEFKEKREEFEGGYLYKIDPKFSVGSIVSNILSHQEPDKTYIIAKFREGYCGVSFRRQDRGKNMNDFIQLLLKGFEDANGGGHAPAAGGQFLVKDYEDFRKRLGIVEK